MAIAIHCVKVGLVQANSIGEVVDKSTASIAAMTDASSVHRVLPNANVPNSNGYPTIEEYLIAEAGDDFKIQYMDQYNIITYEV